MNVRKFFFAPTLIGMLATTTGAAAATLEEVEKDIIGKSGKHKSLEYKSAFTSNQEQEGFSMKSKGTMQGQFKRHDADRYLSRVEIETKGTQKVQGQPEQKIDMTSLVIQDREYMYSYTVNGDMKFATKSKIDPKNQTNPFDQKALFEQMHKAFDMRLLPDETVDGISTYVIEMAPKAGSAAPGVGKTVTYYDKKNGVGTKSVTTDPDGKVTMTSTTIDIKLDGSIPDDRFVFKAPDGVQVVDTTQQGQSTETADNEAQADAAKSDDAKTDAKEDKKEEKKEPEKKKKKSIKDLFKRKK
jgi:outer membrane lipoprotein-sorting protein